MKFRIKREVTSASGWQIYECKANSKEEAFEKFKTGDDKFINEEIEVTRLAEVDIKEIME